MKSTHLSAEFSIGELAGHFGLATHVLRHWESAGLLQPARRVNGRRRYTAEHRTRVAIIVHGRQAGFPLDELRHLLTAGDGAGRREVLRRQSAALATRIDQLAISKELVDHALGCAAEDFLQCPEFLRLVHPLAPSAGCQHTDDRSEHQEGTERQLL
ncbi:MerR family transcriptional regulator [Micromonospora sp. LOL_023]|uniref:MerR family transcriptional regulator n=1 Tax=Micromonospora sp. LOL_023 TaxID=3345418 RepID=UPI003A8C3F6C